MNKPHNNKLDAYLRYALYPFFIYIIIYTIIGSYYSYQVNHNFNMGDWFINYQGGFVRRGLTGEIVYQLYQLTNIPPGLFVVGMHLTFFLIYFYCSWRLLLIQPSLSAYALLIVSPIIFSFQVNDWQGGFRKEIIGVSILSFLCFSSVFKANGIFGRDTKITLLLFPLAILSHELLAVFIPYIFAIYFLKNPMPLKRSTIFFLFSIPAVLAFLISTQYMGNQAVIEKIYASLGAYAPNKGAIYGLIADTHESYSRTLKKIFHRDQKNHYFIALLLISLAFIPIRSRIKHIFTQPFVCLMILASYAMTLPLFLVGTDWGRFIYLHVCALFLLTLTCTEIPVNRLPVAIESLLQKPILNYLLTGFFLINLFIYATQWQMHHCCL